MVRERERQREGGREGRKKEWDRLYVCLLVTLNLSTPLSLKPFSPLILNPFTVLYQGLRLGVLVTSHLDPTVHLTMLSCIIFSLRNHTLLYYTVYNVIIFNFPSCVVSVCCNLFLTQTVWATLWCTVFVPGTYCICRSLLDSWLDHTWLLCAVLYFAV